MKVKEQVLGKLQTLGMGEDGTSLGIIKNKNSLSHGTNGGEVARSG